MTLNSKELLEGATPGDWMVQRTTRQAGRNEGLRIVGPDGYVASVLSYSSRPMEQKERDARLIASAPRLARRVIGLEEALRKIAYLRPAGDIDTAKNTRALVKQIEEIALAALTIQGEAK